MSDRRRTRKNVAVAVPDAERAYLAGLYEMLSDDLPRLRERLTRVAAEAFTGLASRELFDALVEVSKIEAPTLADLARIIREQASDVPAGEKPPAYILMVDLAHKCKATPQGYAVGADRHAKEIMRAAKQRRKLAAARDVAAVAANPSATDDDVAAAARRVVESIEDRPDDGDGWEPLPVELLPDPMRSFVTETAAGLGTDPVLVSLPLLASIAAIIGSRRKIELWNGWQEPCLLWCASIADSGSMKTPSADKALRFIRERQREAFADHAVALSEWEHQKSAHDAAKRSRSKPTEPLSARPQAERFTADDLTIESLAPILMANPRGVLMDRDELSGWFDFDRYQSGGKGGAEVARWLSIYNAGAITVDRKLTGTTYVPSALVSIAGGIQPKVLARVVGSRHVDNGLLQRFILAAPPRRRKVLPGDGPGFATTTAMDDMFSTLFGLPETDGPFDLDHSAMQAFKEFWQENAEEQFHASGAVAAMLSKAEAWAARLALVCHIVRQAGSEPTLANRIDETSILSGIGLARWAAREWRRVFGMMQTGAAEDDDRTLLGWIASRGGIVTPRDVARGPSRYRDNPTAAEAACRRLVNQGNADWVTEATGGRPADAIRLK